MQLRPTRMEILSMCSVQVLHLLRSASHESEKAVSPTAAAIPKLKPHHLPGTRNQAHPAESCLHQVMVQPHQPR
jgi:hypothetical protein